MVNVTAQSSFVHCKSSTSQTIFLGAIRNLWCILVCLDSDQCVYVCVLWTTIWCHIRFLLASQRRYTLAPAVSACVRVCVCVHRGLETGRGSGRWVEAGRGGLPTNLTCPLISARTPGSENKSWLTRLFVFLPIRQIQTTAQTRRPSAPTSARRNNQSVLVISLGSRFPIDGSQVGRPGHRTDQSR